MRTIIIKQKWSESSVSLRSGRTVNLALNESDQTPRSPTSVRTPSPANSSRPSPQPSSSSSTSSPQFKWPKRVKRPVAFSSAIYRRFEKPTPEIPMPTSTTTTCETSVPDFDQPRRQARADCKWVMSTDVEEWASGTEKSLMDLEINELWEARELVYVIEIEDTELDTISQLLNLTALVKVSMIQPASTKVVTFANAHVSFGEEMPSSSRTFRVSSPIEALLDPESGSYYDGSEFSDGDDAECRVISAKKKIQQDLSNDGSYHLK
ncbi:hypothetical protein EVAR_77415_1 [Eumeta japonica]|uniref:Uncharacterized protein n=1 Tax=Eumeta variegata TaxID=151549 RepID=A0A4C1UXD7_EUMVA|nr:hypothetical protein EVAR_77415_1 [Eumeta japonica]